MVPRRTPSGSELANITRYKRLFKRFLPLFIIQFRLINITRSLLWTISATPTSLLPHPFRATRVLTLALLPTWRHQWLLWMDHPVRFWPIGCRVTFHLQTDPMTQPKGSNFTTVILNATPKAAMEKALPSASLAKLTDLISKSKTSILLFLLFKFYFPIRGIVVDTRLGPIQVSGRIVDCPFSPFHSSFLSYDYIFKNDKQLLIR